MSLAEHLQPDVKGRIIGCQAQMQAFEFFFGLSLGERLFSHSDNLSKTLQSTKMSAVSGQHLAQLTKSVLESIRNDDSFSAFYSLVLHKSNEGGMIAEPLLPRKRRAPARIEIGSGPPTFPETLEDHYRRIYFEAIDLIVNAIEQRFSQPSFAAYEKMESLFIKGLNGEPYTSELDYMKAYDYDINLEMLKIQLQVLLQILKGEGPMECFDCILSAVKKLSKAEKSLVSEAVTLCKLLAVNPATSASCERSFLAARRLKTWLRSNMTQQQFSNLTLLNCHKRETEKLNVIEMANIFVGRNDNQKKNFGLFTVADL